MVLQCRIASELACAFLALVNSGHLAGDLGLMHLVLEVLVEGFEADEIALTVAAPEFHGVRARLKVLHQSGTVGKGFLAYAALMAIAVAPNLADRWLVVGAFFVF